MRRNRDTKNAGREGRQEVNRGRKEGRKDISGAHNQ